MAAIEVEFDVWCSCGSGLDRGTTVEPGNSRRLAAVTIEPCENCLAQAETSSFDKGYGMGHDEGYDKGYDDGLVNAASK